MDLEKYLSHKMRLIEERLPNYMSSLPTVADQLEQAMNYSVFAGGKRIRPILTLASAEALGGTIEKALPAACALELIHTYSLIHDDLPAMDDDDWRRGKPTNHTIFGEAQAILAGDALLTQAFVILSSTNHETPLEPEIALRIIHEVAKASGPEGMVGGQSVDINCERTFTNDIIGAEKLLDYIHVHKTGCLLKAAVRVGAIVSGASPKELAALTSYSEKIGLAFQICDDILNATGDARLIGKPVKTDEKRQKLTYVAIHGLELAKESAQILAKEAVAALNDFDAAADPLRALAYYTVNRQK